MSDKSLVWSFWLYTIIWDCGIMGAALYAVFWRDFNGWWVLGAFAICACSYKPWHWRSIVTGEKSKSWEVSP